MSANDAGLEYNPEQIIGYRSDFDRDPDQFRPQFKPYPFWILSGHTARASEKVGKGLTALAKLFLANALRKQADRSPRFLEALWRIEAGLIATLSRLCTWLSPDRASLIGRGLLRVLGPRLQKSSVIRRNLSIAFPEKSTGEIDALIKDIWGNLGAVVAEFPHLTRICGAESDERIEIIRAPGLRVFSDSTDRCAVFVAAHLANWELPAATASSLGVQLSVVYTPMHNPRMDRMLQDARNSLGCNLINRNGAVRQLVRQLARGNSVGLLQAP